ncbi:uncharacterized protein TRIADDRAFT_56185 [Trichoplax adhaerens]|uniref:Uncharacterized protein n=1 Tax=Trichoplax adhaerens TaxID=10228 RepID=B3RXE9_TRIAD|nr:hypothetical protein TRIADDRAFT_56185 [Trichoplax adhaerens]EDV24409.1 hypothetical protein TRIADDRAFT_56185 [Trichoplax adhaerens]|eukprot:XP_002112299.1 hypothetical protein TRIADDRAFT_56185 [Trichoplax adhaerens]
MYAWLILQTRTQCLSHLIDPSLKKPSVTAGLPTKNDFLLLQYYLMLSCACCTHSILNPNNQCLSDQVYGVSIELGEKSENLKSNDPIQAYLKTVLSLLRHDSEAVSDAAISALGHCNAATFKLLSSEISIMLKERVDKQKAESVRKRRKRDPIRIKFVKIFEIAAENSCFVPKYEIELFNIIEGLPKAIFIAAVLLNLIIHALHNSNFTVDKNTGLNMIFVDYIETTRQCRNPPKDVMLSALEGMSAIACCGPVFDPKGIEENGYLYEWLDSIIECKSNRKIYGIGCRTVELLLAYNETCHYFLDWISNKCLTASPLASCGLFRAFLNIFSRRNYPLRLIRTLNVILFKAMDTDQESRGCAVRMLHVLDKRYLSIYRESTGLNVFSSSQFALITLKPEVDLSATLAKLYPEFTIPMFSEMCVSLRKNVTEKRRLFINMLPWMQNIELIDNAASSHVTSNTEMICDVNLDEFLQARGRLQGEGWGSVTATEVVVCNLFHITCKYSDDYARELANLWCALCDAWNGNLRVIKNFFCILAGAGLSNSLLAQIKTVIMYIGERMPDRVIEELFQDLRLVENLAYSFDSSDSTGKQLAFLVKAKCLDPTVNTSNQNTTSDGADHTKKRKHSSVSDFVNVTNPSEDGFYRTIHRDGKYETEFSSDTSTVKEEFLTWAKSWSLSIRNGNGKPVPLPTPSDLLTHAPLYELFSADKSTIGHFRCYFSLMLISELLLNRVTFDSHIHMPLLLHVICLGMDHVHQVVHDHCKCLLIRLLILISYQDHLLDIDTFVGIHPFSTDVLDSPSEVIKRLRKGRKLTTGETLIADVDSLSTREFNKIEKLIELLLLSGHKPLWQCEEVTPRNMSIKSIDSLENFVKSIIDAASVLQSCKELKENWIQVALQWATSCSSRHYAGRSFQVLRLLCPPLNWPAFSDILSRLCDTATDLNEDVQGYVLEILLTLESAIDMRLSPLKKAIDEKLGRLKTDTNNFQKKRKNSTAEMYAGSQRSKIRQRNTSSISGNSIINVHTKSGSRSESISSITEELKIDEFCNDETFDVISGDVSRQVNYDDVAKGNSESKADRHGNNHTDDNLITEDELSLLLSEESRDLLARIFWSCVCLLESDYEHEFLVSLRIINKLFKSLRFCKVQFYANLEIILNQMEWTNYPGLHALLLKGLTIPSIVTSTLQLLCWLIPDNDYRIIDPSQRIALPLSMIAVLPYLIQNFDSPDDFCISCAQSFGSTCEKSRNLNNVATLLKMYIDKKYPQPCQVWLSAVCKYINDAYPDLLTTILTFLLEVLEFCPDNVRREHLLVLQSYVKHIDILSSDVQQWGGELIRTICRSLTGSHWSEALDIIRLVVAKSSVNSPQDSNEPRALWRLDTFGGMVKRELPGPTLSFNYDLSSTKIIGFSNTSYPVNLIHSPISSENDEDDELEIEKMCAAQNRTRNCLRLLTSTCGNKSALIKNSYQSIVFSSTSSMQAFDRRQTIEKSSSDEGLIMDEVTHKNSDFRRRSLIGVVTDFDFLDDEYKVNEQANSPLFNWASVSVLHSPSAESIISTTQEEINLRKDLSELASICKEMYESSDEESQSTIDDEESVKSIDINFKVESEELSVLPGPHTGDIPELVVDQKCDVEVAISDNRMEKLSESGTEISQDSCKLVTHKAGSHISMSSLESSIGIASEETYKRGSSASDGGMKELSEMWQIHASAVLSKRINSKLSCTHEIFIKTFNSIISTYQRLTDKSREITQLDEFQGIVVKLSHVSQLLYQVEIPFVYTDWESLTETGLMQEHAFHIIELHNYCKNICNLTDKLWEELYDITATEDICETVILKRVQESRIQLYGDLYQAAFTIILLLENYNKNIRELSMAISKSSKIVNITEDIEKCRTSLIDVKNKPSDRTSSPSSFWSETSNVKQKAISNIQECLVEESFQEALRLLHNSRRKWSGDVFGKDDKEDINILLTIYFKSVIAIQDYAEEVLRTCYTPIKGLLLEILPQLNDLKHEILCNYSNTSEVFHESKVFN